MNYILLHDSSSARQANGNKKDQILWTRVCEIHRQTATKRRSTADRRSFPSSLSTCILQCKNLNCRNKEKRENNMMKWGGNEKRSTGGGSCAQICPISFSGEMSLWSFTTGSERSINCERLILSALNYKRQQQIILDGEEGVCHGHIIYHQSKKYIL